MMGTTETHAIGYCTVGPKFSYPKDGVLVGYPVPGKTILLLDDNGQEVECGQVGEIAVKTRYLASGYWRMPELTRAKFLPDPNGGSERIYLTGDLGQSLPDGFMIHRGRKDFQVKIRGYRIEISEIETALLGHPKVKDVGVVAWDQEPGEKYLVAYVAPHDDVAPTIDELHNFLKAKLADYMMPSAFMFLRSLPLTNGKLDRTALPRPDHKRPHFDLPYAPPQDHVETKLVQIWEEILDVRPIGIRDNFFDLGGHSLTASRVISRVIQMFQLELPIKALFDSPTVAEMASVIAANQANPVSQGELERMLSEVEAISYEEAQRRVNKSDSRIAKK